MFPSGWPGRGLLLLRVAAGSVLIYDGIVQLSAQPRSDVILVQGPIIGLALLLLIGLWTPIVGILIALLEIRNGFLNTDHLRSIILLAALGLALAMLGPGGRSIDARLFGRKRIDISPR